MPSGSGLDYATPSASGRIVDPALATAPAPKWLGKRVGRFRLIGVIGRGANGKVFRAEDIQLHRLVALKVISSRSSRNKTAAQKQRQFLHEARLAAKLEHPNLVSVYEVNSSSDIHFIAMELVEGGNLKDLVIAAGPLDIPRACQLCAEAAEGLHHAHEQNIVHRDVKPANLMLTRSGRCKLGDFGLARLDEAEAAPDGRPSAVGTPLFVAPEVVLGEEATALSDVYSLGATLFFLLTGNPPFPGDVAKEVLQRHIEELPPDLRTLRPDVPEALALAVWRALAKHPSQRFESAGHFARALRHHTIQVDATANDLPTATSRAAGRFQWSMDRRTALLALLGGGALVVLLVCLIVLATRGGRSDGNRSGDPTAVGGGRVAVETAADKEPPDAPTPLPPPGAVLQATEQASLLAVAREPNPARHDGHVTVEGWVRRVQELGAEPTSATIFFQGVDRKRGVIGHLPPDAYATLTDRLGGDPKTKLPGKRIRMAGIVELSEGQPELIPDTPGSVEVLP